MTPRLEQQQNSSIGDVTSRLKNFEIKLSDQKEIANDRFLSIETQLKDLSKRISILEEKQQNTSYKEKIEVPHDNKIEERLRRFEEKLENLNHKFIDEKLLQMKFENFERMWKNSKEKDQSTFQEDVLNEINNLYSLLRRNLNNQRDFYFESQNLKKHITTTTKTLENEIKYDRKVFKANEQKSPLNERYERKSPLKYEQKSPKIRNYERNISPKKPPLEVFEESKRKIYQEMLKISHNIY